jgi:hypothetical protein
VVTSQRLPDITNKEDATSYTMARTGPEAKRAEAAGTAGCEAGPVPAGCTVLTLVQICQPACKPGGRLESRDGAVSTPVEQHGYLNNLIVTLGATTQKKPCRLQAPARLGDDAISNFQIDYGGGARVG